MALGKKNEVPRLLDRAVAKKPEGPRRLGLAFHFEKIELEKSEIGRARRGGFTDHGGDVISLRLSFEPRGHVDVVADHRIVEARFRAEVPDAADAGAQASAEPHRLEFTALGLCS